MATALGLLLSSPDVEQVTIARITEAAGCTPPTLYHYWPSRSALLLEASARGWETFRSSQAIAPGSPDPQERLRARGQAYLRFAITHPELFRVLFLSRSEEVERGSALDDLIDDVAAAIDEGYPFGDAGQLRLGVVGDGARRGRPYLCEPSLRRSLPYNLLNERLAGIPFVV